MKTGTDFFQERTCSSLSVPFVHDPNRIIKLDQFWLFEGKVSNDFQEHILASLLTKPVAAVQNVTAKVIFRQVFSR